MTTLRYLVLLATLPTILALGLLLDLRFGVALAVLVGLLLAWQARRLGTSFAGIVANFTRAYRSLPRLLWAWDRHVARQASGPDLPTVEERVGPTRFLCDLPALEARELAASVRQTHEGLAALFPGCRPTDRVLLFGRQAAMLRYLGGWFGTLGTKAAGFCFAMGPVRVVGAVDAFQELGRDPRALLAHELVHGGLRGVGRGLGLVPWLNEGLAEALAVSWFEPARVPGLRRLLRRARAAGHWLDWDELAAVRPGHVVVWLKSGDPALLVKTQLLYAQSCLLVLDLIGREEGAHPCLRAMLARPQQADATLRRGLGFDGAALSAWVARDVDAAPLELTPWDRARRETLRSLLAQSPPSRFRPTAALGLASCGDADDLPLLADLAAGDDPELSTMAGLAMALIRAVPAER